MKHVFALLTLTCALLLLTSTGAVPLAQQDSVTDDVHLYPATEGPGADDTSLDEDGDLVVNVADGADGVNGDAVTTFETLFYVRYDGSDYADVWITHESRAVTFRARGRAIQSEATSLTLGPNESAAVGIAVDTTGDTGRDLIDEMIVHAQTADGAPSPTPDGDDRDVSVVTTSEAPTTRSPTSTAAPSPSGLGSRITAPPAPTAAPDATVTTAPPTPATATTPTQPTSERTADLPDEPAAFGFGRAVGLAGVLVGLAAGLVLVRRVAR